MNRVFLQKSTHSGSKDSKELYQLLKTDSPDQFEHLSEHLKVETGSNVKVAVEDKGLATAVVSNKNENSIFFEIKEFSPAKTQPYTLLVGASRPPTMKKILEHGTSLGVKKFVFFPASLSEKSYLKSKIYEKSALNDLLRLGVEQAGQFCELPKVILCDNIQEAITYTKGAKLLLSLSEKETNPVSVLDDAECTLAIGPERGWIEKEDQFFRDQGFQAISLTENILRVEIATFVALGQLEYLFKKKF